MRVILLIVTIILSGCNGESYEEVEIEEIKAPVISYIAPIGNIDSEPYKATVFEPEPYLELVYNGMTSTYAHENNATVYAVVTESKMLSDYEIDVTLSYRYRVRQNIMLENGMCASVWYWNSKEPMWSDTGDGCSNLSPTYTQEEFMALNGWMEVEKGNNFEVLFPRIGGLSMEMNIR